MFINVLLFHLVAREDRPSEVYVVVCNNLCADLHLMNIQNNEVLITERKYDTGDHMDRRFIRGSTRDMNSL